MADVKRLFNWVEMRFFSRFVSGADLNSLRSIAPTRQIAEEKVAITFAPVGTDNSEKTTHHISKTIKRKPHRSITCDILGLFPLGWMN
ncbi:MAG: hypothetical protein IJX05_01440 [Clostridia bacterium]|nr:hypothetical protein [Clostridia bacterium]